MVLAHKQMCRPLSWKKRGLRNTPTELEPPACWQSCQKHTVEKRQSLYQMVLGTGLTHAGEWTKSPSLTLLRIPFKVQGPMKSPARLMLQLPLCSSGFQVTALLGLILSSTFSNLFHISSLYITVVESPSFIWHYSGSHWAPVLFQVLGFLEGYFHLKRQNGEMGNKFIYMNIYIYMYTK